MVAKNCIDCGPQHPRDFHAKKRDARGHVTQLQARCKECAKAATRWHLGMKKRGRPYDERRPSTAMTHEEQLAVRRDRYRQRRELEAERKRIAYAKKKLDPEFMEAKRRREREKYRGLSGAAKDRRLEQIRAANRRWREKQRAGA